MAVALLLPLSFYFIARVLKKDRIYLPSYYLVERIDSTWADGVLQTDTIYRQAGEIQLVNQLGDTVMLNKDLEGKILVVNFFFTSCPSTCPKLSANMALLQRAFRQDARKEFKMVNELRFVSVSVDPETDTPPVLREYADSYGADHDRWWLLTGDKKNIYQYARHELAVIAHPGDGGAEDYIHTEKFILLDKDRHIRGYYDGLDTLALRKCAEDAVLLTMEKKKKKK